MQPSRQNEPCSTQIEEITAFDAGAHAWKWAIRLIEADQVLVAPTDTVYGIMCRYDSAEAVERLYAIKQRPTHKAIPVLIGDHNQLTQVTGAVVDDVVRALMERYWPGPLTLVLPTCADLPTELTAGGGTVGVRMPDHNALRALMRVVGPLAATSANLSGDEEAVTSASAQEQLDGHVPLILSDDATRHRPTPPVPSTVVDLSGSCVRILRAGPIQTEVAAALNELGVEIC